ncbi:pilus assembly protein [Kordiimonas sediminis]|uniref:Pilus assembly protein n=1 Tax=Kordiimonas sediminis TaxID=1735581 RepID=A0A919AIE3_9PROT|nr:type II secretion system F family protein [Kordiimonas sediminis]GHF11312.1 pilus assembly protein [Kordiimonas sediminis]
MQFSNTDIILLASGLGLLIVLGAVYFLMETLNGTRKQNSRKLEMFKAKFGNMPMSAKARSIRVKSDEEGLSAMLAKLLPNKDIIEQRLKKTGKDISLPQYALFNAFAAIGAFFVFMVVLQLMPILAIALSIIVGVGLPHMIIGKMVSSRMERFTAQFPEALDLMVRGLKSGLPVNETIISVAEEVEAPTGAEFRKIADAMRFGTPLEQALWEASDRLDTADFKFFVISLVVQRETGGNLGETLGNLSNILRARQAMKLKIAALSSEAKASAWIVGLLPFIMAVVLLMLNYDYAIILYTDPRAQMVGIGALLWMAIGVFIMARMIDFDV